MTTPPNTPELQCLRINEAASMHGMTATLLRNDSDSGYLIKICVQNVPSETLLVLQFQPYLSIYEHRNRELTTQHRGKKVSFAWIEAFLAAHAEGAREILKIEANKQNSEAAARQKWLAIAANNASAALRTDAATGNAKPSDVLKADKDDSRWDVCHACGSYSIYMCKCSD